MLLRELTDLNVPGARDISSLARTWETMLDQFPGWFWATDERYELTYLSENVSRITGSSQAELIGISILDPNYGDVKTEAGIQELYSALLAQKPFYNLCYERNMKDGSRIVLMDSAEPVYDADGHFRGFHGISLHVSHATERAGATSSLVYGLMSRADALEKELSRRNAELEASNKLQSEVLEAMGEGLLVTSGTELNNPDTTVVMVNPAYRALFGFRNSEVQRGTSLPSMIGRLLKRREIMDDPEALREFEDAIASGRPVLLDLKNKQKTTSIKASRRKTGGYIIVHTDVTDLKSQNVKLERALDTAEVATEAKSKFLATMSHEIRTPMNGIVGMADLLANTALDEDQSGFVETIRSSALALTNLISDILDFSKIEAERLKLDETPYALHDFLQEIGGLVRGLAHTKGLQLEVIIREGVPVGVMGDAFRLRQILLNLLGNAVKFSPEGAVTLTVTPGNRAEDVVFEIADTGIGIPEDMLDHIFTPFEQVEGGLRRGFEGSGLGLSITRSLVNAMGGEISVTSEIDFGSTFRVTLPLPKVNFVERSVVDDTMKVEMDFAGLQVLVAEDNKTNQLVVRRMLERAGITITTANNGQEACDIFAAKAFDLVLMDLSMPKMSGLEACGVIRAYEVDHGMVRCPIVALTGNAFERDRDAALAAGMDDFLAKPVRLAKLLGCIERHTSHSDQLLQKAVGLGD